MSNAVGTLQRLKRSQVISERPGKTFEIFSDASLLEAMTPPFLRFRILTPQPIAMGVGTRIEYSLSLYGVPLYWRTLITEWEHGVRFVDEQEEGPYAYWRHQHEFRAMGGQTLMLDLVEYAEPLGLLGKVAHHLFVARTLDRIFDYRHAAADRLLHADHGPEVTEYAN